MPLPSLSPAAPESAVAALFGLPVAAAFAAAQSGMLPLLGAELEAAASMSPRRADSFRRGRGCARRALAALGLPDRAVPMGSARAPVWPAGIAGSIAHCDDAAVAVAARLGPIVGLGIDIEPDGTLEPGVLDLVLTPVERAHPANRSVAKALFSVKESIYKCLWPTVRRYIDFQDIEIQWRPDEPGAFRVTAPHDRVDAALLAALEGRVARVGHWWIAGTLLRAGPQP